VLLGISSCFCQRGSKLLPPLVLPGKTRKSPAFRRQISKRLWVFKIGHNSCFSQISFFKTFMLVKKGKIKQTKHLHFVPIFVTDTFLRCDFLARIASRKLFLKKKQKNSFRSHNFHHTVFLRHLTYTRALLVSQDRQHLFVTPWYAVCGKPSLYEFIGAVTSFFQPIPPRCDASNSGISQSLSRPTLQPEEECRNIKGLKHREKVIKACDVPRQAVVKVFSALGSNQRESKRGTRQVAFALSSLKGQ
jgi:hypothetical protein